MWSRMYAMSVVTLRANPCIVRPRASRTPIAAILRGFGPSASTHTPGYSASRPAPGTPSLGRATSIRRSSTAANVLERALGVREVDDRVADELTGTVVRDVAAALDRHEVGADRGRVALQVGREVGMRAVGEHMVVFEQQQVLLVPVIEQRLLHRQRLAVRHPPQPAGCGAGRRAHVRARRSSRAISRISLTRLRKPAA